MSKRTFNLTAATLMLVAAAVRVSNSFVWPPLKGYDSFGHFTYIWFLADTWRIPDATAGWSFFHPPLYYAVMASVWNCLTGLDPFLRLHIGTAIMGILSLGHAVVSYLLVRRYAPDNRVLQLVAPGLMLFIPVHLYGAPFLGNEGLNAVLCSISLLLAVLVLDRATMPRMVTLGVCLGLAMLTKFTALVAVASVFATIALKAVVKGNVRLGIRTLAIVGLVLVTVCGWYYARNVSLYGTPFKMSRDEFMVRHIEKMQTQGERGFLEYVLFDPGILFYPQFPRGMSIRGDVPPGAIRSPLRESVWTGVFANAWFDGFGAFVTPPLFASNKARRAGQVLLSLGAISTLLILVGIGRGVTHLCRKGWRDDIVLMLIALLAMCVLFIRGTLMITGHHVLKATYFMPATVTFSFFLALGTEWAMRWKTAARVLLFPVFAMTIVASTVVFTHGVLFRHGMAAIMPGLRPPWQNLHGVVYYAAGWKPRAKELFQAAANGGLYIGFENLAILTLDEGDPRQALDLMREALKREPEQSLGLPDHRATFDRLTQAEYLTSMSVMYYELGRLTAAKRVAKRALTKDPSIPEAHYNLGIAILPATIDTAREDAGTRRSRIMRARRHFARAFKLDAGFFEALAMQGVAEALSGDCASATTTIREAMSPHPGQYRLYPVETGPGNVHAAAIGRRRYVTRLPEELQPRYRLDRCATVLST